MNISFREARNSDSGTICSILESQKLATESVETGKTDFFLAFENNTPIGVAGFEYYGNDYF